MYKKRLVVGTDCNYGKKMHRSLINHLSPLGGTTLFWEEGWGSF